MMVRILCSIFTVLLGLLAYPAAASTLVIHPDSQFRQLNAIPYISQYRGQPSLETIQQASTLPDAAFSPIGSASPLRLMETAWFRLVIQNDSLQHRTLILDLDQALLSRIEWRASSASSLKEILTGQSYPHASRDVDYDFFAFRLDIPAGETLTVNFSIRTPYAAIFVPKLTDSERFISGLTFSSRFAGAIMGMLYAIVFFLFLYILRIRKFGIEHAMFMFSFACLLSVLYVGGAIQRYLPDSGFPLRDVAYIAIHGSQGMAFCMVLRGFYKTALNYKLVDKLLLALIAGELVVFLLVPFANVDYLLLVTLFFNSFMMLGSVCLALLALVRRHTETYLFGVGLLLFIAMAMTSSLASIGILPISFLTRYGYELGLTILVDFIFLAVVSRIFSAERENLAMETEMIQLDAEMKARSEFVNRVTHDIKSPLSAVLGAVQLLRQKGVNEGAEAYLGVIQRSCGAVISIVDDILTHSRMKAYQMSLRVQPFILQELLIDIESSIKASQQHRHLVFSLTVGDELPSVINGDKLKLSQLLLNLLTNAFKFTDEGRVGISVDLAEKKQDGILVRFVIQDTGIGMSEKFLQHAFEPYAREDGREGYRPGFGLGLSICKQIVDLMGGSIDVLSAVGQGSRFTVLLPFTLPE